jgi:hypothetical protein
MGANSSRISFITGDTLNVTLNTPIKFTGVPQGMLPYNSITGLFTLEPNATYELSAGLIGTNVTQIQYRWMNMTSNAPIVGTVGIVQSTTSASNTIAMITTTEQTRVAIIPTGITNPSSITPITVGTPGIQSLWVKVIRQS